MAVKRSGLGKGLDSLIPNKVGKKSEEKSENLDYKSEKKTISEKSKKENIKKIEESNEENGYPVKKEQMDLMVDINEVEPNRNQPRNMFDEDSLLELSESIKQFGIIQPLIVQKKKDYYEIIAGERRWRAAKLAGLKQVPVLIKDYSQREVVEIALIENIQRENLNPIEEALAFKRLMEEYSLKQDEVAERVSKSRTAVTNSMRLLKLDQRIQQMIVDDMITTGHGRALLGVEDLDHQYMLAQKIFDEKLSVRETEKLIKLLNSPKKEAKKKEKIENDFIYKNLEEKMREVVGTKVKILQKGKGKGKIEIEYYSEDELERIYELIRGISSK